MGPYTQRWAVRATGCAHVGLLRRWQAVPSAVCDPTLPLPPGAWELLVWPHLHFPDHLVSQPSSAFVSHWDKVFLKCTFLYWIDYLFLTESSFYIWIWLIFLYHQLLLHMVAYSLHSLNGVFHEQKLAIEMESNLPSFPYGWSFTLVSFCPHFIWNCLSVWMSILCFHPDTRWSCPPCPYFPSKFSDVGS